MRNGKPLESRNWMMEKIIDHVGHEIVCVAYAGYVAVGNSLTNPVGGPDLFPQIGEGGELWFTPGLFTPVWNKRRQIELVKLMASGVLAADASGGHEGGGK